MTLKNGIIQLLRDRNGLTDREITDSLVPTGGQQPVNRACRELVAAGMLVRRKEGDRIRNYLEADTGIERLRKIGFRLAGTWALRDGRPVAAVESNTLTLNVLYAFVTNGIVRYVGKTTQGLGKRLRQYENPEHSQRTNVRNHRTIKAALEGGKRVEIYVMPAPRRHTLGGFQVNLAAGLEDSIIKVLAPEWNY